MTGEKESEKFISLDDIFWGSYEDKKDTKIIECALVTLERVVWDIK